MIPENPKISIVVSSYGRFAQIQNLVLSAEQAFPADQHEVIAVCSDHLVTEKMNWLPRQPNVRTLQADVRTRNRLRSLYFYENYGIKVARGEWVFVTNDDTTFDPDFYSNLLKMENDYDVILVQGHVGEVGLGARIPTIGTLTRPGCPTEPLYLYDFSLVRRSVYETIGYLDERIDWYGKGWDLAMAIEFTSNARIAHFSDIKVNHMIAQENRMAYNAAADFGYIRAKWDAWCAQHPGYAYTCPT